MAFRRNTTRGRARGKRVRRSAPLRTYASKETRWNTSRWSTIYALDFEDEEALDVDLVVLNPRIMFEVTLQPDVAVGGPVRNIAPLINQAQSLRGVKIGGIVWDSGFHVQRAINPIAEEYVNAYSRVTETLWTRNVEQQDGIADNPPQMQDTWRPLRVDDSVFDPTENAGDLVRIHHTRSSLLAVGTNAFGPLSGEATAYPAAAAASTWTQPGWGGARSLRLRKFIRDDQTLNFNIRASNGNSAATVTQQLRWVCFATVYWALENQK